MDAASYVLQEFSKAQAEILPITLNRAADAVFTFVIEGIEAAMNQFNGVSDLEEGKGDQR
jgi:peptidyl-tRNA hydrolase